MERIRKQPKRVLLPSDYLGFKSVVETRNVFDCNSVDRTQEDEFCANEYFGFRFLNNQIINEIGLRPPKESIVKWLKEREFYFIDFNLMCVLEKKAHRYYYPVELGLVKYSMVNGIIEEYHTFIDCGEIPEGCAGQAIQNENKHRIPLFDTSALRKLCFDTVDTIVEKLHHLITKDKKTLTKDKKFVCFNVPDKRTQTYGGYEWLHLNNDCTVELPEFSVLSVYDLTHEIAKFMEITEIIDFTTISNEFNTVSYDYDSEIYCTHHDDVSCNNCAIANSRRLAFVFSFLMSRCFDISPISSKNRKEKSVSNSDSNLVKSSIEDEDQAIVKVLKAPPDNDNNIASRQTSQKQRKPQPLSVSPGYGKGSRQRPNYANDERKPNGRKEERLANDAKNQRPNHANERRTNYVKDDRRIGANAKAFGFSPLPNRPVNASKDERRPETNWKHRTQIFSRSSRQPFNFTKDERVEKNRLNSSPRFSGNSHRQSNFTKDNRRSDKNAKSTPPGFSRISERQPNVTKDERRFGTSIKTVPPGFRGSTECKVNIDSVNDALRNANI